MGNGLSVRDVLDSMLVGFSGSGPSRTYPNSPQIRLLGRLSIEGMPDRAQLLIAPSDLVLCGSQTIFGLFEAGFERHHARDQPDVDKFPALRDFPCCQILS